MDFIKNALREFRHVVWPTRDETKKYFVVVLAVLVSFWMYLFVVWNIFSEILFWLKNMVNPNSSSSADIQLPEWLEWLNIPSEATETEIVPEIAPELEAEDAWISPDSEGPIAGESTEVQ